MNSTDKFSPKNLESRLQDIKSEKLLPASADNLKLMFSLIDLTSLNTQDTSGQIETMCQKVNDFPNSFPGINNVGAICVYPVLIPIVKKCLSVQGMGIASVAAGFPSSQTFLKIKEQESIMAVEAGATEVDIVISVGKFLENDLDFIRAEVLAIKKAIAPAKLKVILETGLLPAARDIYRASTICLEAGADFIKTSTGKVQPAATPEAVLVMCHAIKDHYENTGKMAGIKPAGGISSPEQALEYASIIKSVLGGQWLNPGLFRIGASRLANNLLSAIMQLESGNSSLISYF